jgi:ATP-dependent DNA ligase
MLSRTRSLPLGFIEPVIPTITKTPPAGPEWVHEIKHDGYRLVARVIGSSLRMYSRRGVSFGERYPRALDGLRRLRASSATIDGEVVVICPARGWRCLTDCTRASPSTKPSCSLSTSWS